MIHHSFNSEHNDDKLIQIESLIKLKESFTVDYIVEEKETLRKRNKLLKIAEKHVWDITQEYLDSPLVDDKDDTGNLSTAIAWASRKRNSKPYSRPLDRSPVSDIRYSARGPKFNAKNFL